MFFKLRTFATTALILISSQSGQAELISHWKLDETSGTTAANEVGSIDGANNGATVGQTGVAGTAYEFSGSDIIDTGFHPVPTDDDFSLFMWIKGDGEQGSHVLAAGHNGQAGRWTLQFSTGEGNPLMFFHGGAGGAGSNTAENLAPLDGEWHHIGITRDGGEVTLWMDGTGETVLTGFSGTLNDDYNFTLGARGTSSNPAAGYEGLMDDVQLYDEALTETQVDWLADNPGQVIVPEPGSAALLTSGGLVLLARRRPVVRLLEAVGAW